MFRTVGILLLLGLVAFILFPLLRAGGKKVAQAYKKASDELKEVSEDDKTR